MAVATPPRRCAAPLTTVGAAVLATLLANAGPGVTSSAAATDRAVRCERLDARIEALRLKLRMGYTASQGRLWRTQLRGLEAERRASCR